MSHDTSDDDGVLDDGERSPAYAETGGRPPVTAGSLLREGLADLRRQPSVVLAMALAGLAVAVVDRVRVTDPVPVAEFVGVTDGRILVAYGVMGHVPAGATTPLAALVSLRPTWLAWVTALELLRTGALVLACSHGFATLLSVTPRPRAVARYAGVFAAFAALRWLAPRSDAPLLLGLAVVTLFLFVLARLAAVPMLIVSGRSVPAAFVRSWSLARGHTWPLVGIVVTLGLALFLLASVPLAGPVLASLGVALQVATVAAFVRRVD